MAAFFNNALEKKRIDFLITAFPHQQMHFTLALTQIIIYHQRSHLIPFKGK